MRLIFWGFLFSRWDFKASVEDMESIRQLLNSDLKVPLNFRQTVPAYDPKVPRRSLEMATLRTNCQTTELCSKLNIIDPFQKLLDLVSGRRSGDSSLNLPAVINESEANVTITDDSSHNVSERDSLDRMRSGFDDDDLDDPKDFTEDSSAELVFRETHGHSDLSLSQSTNPDEISLDDSGDEAEGHEDEAQRGDDADAIAVELSLPLHCTSTPKPFSALQPRTRSSISGRLPLSQLDPVIQKDKPCVNESPEDTPFIKPRVSDDDDKSLSVSVTLEHPTTPSSLSPSQSVVGKQVKFLKRRNQAIYAPSDEDDSESS